MRAGGGVPPRRARSGAPGLSPDLVVAVLQGIAQAGGDCLPVCGGCNGVASGQDNGQGTSQSLLIGGDELVDPVDQLQNRIHRQGRPLHRQQHLLGTLAGTAQLGADHAAV